MPAFDDYLPEELETPNRELIAFLERIYQEPVIAEETISKAEQERILVEVRTSLLATDPVVSPLKEKNEEHKHTFISEEMRTDQVQVHDQLFAQNKRPLSHRVQHLLEASIAAVLVASLLLGWFAILRTHSTQGAPTPFFTYTGQPGEDLYDLQWTPDRHYLTFMACKHVGPNASCRYLIWSEATGKVKQTLM